MRASDAPLPPTRSRVAWGLSRSRMIGPASGEVIFGSNSPAGRFGVQPPGTSRRGRPGLPAYRGIKRALRDRTGNPVPLPLVVEPGLLKGQDRLLGSRVVHSVDVARVVAQVFEAVLNAGEPVDARRTGRFRRQGRHT